VYVCVHAILWSSWGRSAYGVNIMRTGDKHKHVTAAPRARKLAVLMSLLCWWACCADELALLMSLLCWWVCCADELALLMSLLCWWACCADELHITNPYVRYSQVPRMTIAKNMRCTCKARCCTRSKTSSLQHIQAWWRCVLVLVCAHKARVHSFCVLPDLSMFLNMVLFAWWWYLGCFKGNNQFVVLSLPVGVLLTNIAINRLMSTMLISVIVFALNSAHVRLFCIKGVIRGLRCAHTIIC